MTTAMVTGATAGIGNAFARRFAQEGKDLVIVSRDAARMRALADEWTATYGINVEVLPADLCDEDAVQIVCERLSDPQRPIDLLVNNAGFGLRESFLGSAASEQLAMFDILCRAVLLTTHAATSAMVPRGHGGVINVSSVAGYTLLGTYAAAKSWTTTFTEVVHHELRGTGVRAMALCPGYVRTEFHERAQLKVGGVPEALWLDADDLVAACVADFERGRAVSVPSFKYQALTTVSRHLPRRLLRNMSGAVRDRRDSSR